jgi:hypothetical protein
MRFAYAFALGIVWSACGRSALEFLPSEAADSSADSVSRRDSATAIDVKTNTRADGVSDTAHCAGTWSFAPQATYATKGAPSAIAVGDFNGDGHPDLALANYGPAGAVGVLFNSGDGTFGAPVTYSVGNSPESIAVGDFNGDGAPDLVVTNINDNTIGVLLNAGNGTFHPQVTYAVGNSPNSLAVGDFNHDGSPDLAVANGDWPCNLSVFFNAGKGTFSTPVTYSASYWPSYVVAADFNRDGVPDLAYADMGQGGTVDVLLNTGNGAFGTSLASPDTANAETSSIAVADFNGDGYPDLVAANDFVPGNMVVMLNSGNGAFGTQVT